MYMYSVVRTYEKLNVYKMTITWIPCTFTENEDNWGRQQTDRVTAGKWTIELPQVLKAIIRTCMYQLKLYKFKINTKLICSFSGLPASIGYLQKS